VKTYPKYEKTGGLDRHAMRVMVALRTRSVCGPVIQARHAVAVLTTTLKETASATTLALAAAEHELSRQHAAVVAACRKQGTHDGHE
jgi:hypothetical protein